MSEPLIHQLARLPEGERRTLLREVGMDPDDPAAMAVLNDALKDWRFLARPEQLPPADYTPPTGDGPPILWLTWLFMAGRGAGKTRSASEFVTDRAEHHYLARERGYATHPATGTRLPPPEQPEHRIALAGRATTDVRDVIIEGVSGVMAIAERRGHRCIYEPSKRRVTWPDLGAVATTFTAEEPEQGRGPEFHTVWADEIAAWDNTKTDAMGNNLWTNLTLALRLGIDPRAVVTTTPKRVDLVKELVEAATARNAIKRLQKSPTPPDPFPTPDDLINHRTVMTTGSTKDNEANLSPAFIAAIHEKYAGTSLAKQELEGVLLEDVEGALWSGAMLLDAVNHGVPPIDLTPSRLVVAVDPPTSVGRDETGIVAAGLLPTLPPAPDRIPGPGAIILRDASAPGLTPEQWAARAVQTAIDIGATRIVVEANQGGEMNRAVLTNAMATLGLPSHAITIDLIRATVGKQLRAEPVSQLYEQRRVIHATEFPDLEDQMQSWTPEDKDSPDRLDALVHAVTSLLPHLTSSPAQLHSPTRAHPGRTRITRTAGPADAPLRSDGRPAPMSAAAPAGASIYTPTTIGRRYGP